MEIRMYLDEAQDVELLWDHGTMTLRTFDLNEGWTDRELDLRKVEKFLDVIRIARI